MSVDFKTYREQEVNAVISHYNSKWKKAYEFSNMENRVAAVNALELCQDIFEVYDFIDGYPIFDGFTTCMWFLIAEKRRKADEEPKDEPKDETPIEEDAVSKEPVSDRAPVTDQTVNYSMGLLEKAVVGLIAGMKSDEIKAQVMGSVEQAVKDFIKEEYGTIERKVNTIIDGKKVQIEGVQHEKFEEVLKFVANNEPVFLTGAAGSGKNVLCQQVAQALGLKFYFTNAVTQEYKLTGFTDAMGVFQESSLYKAMKNGGLFMLDEIDASIPEVLVILNSVIANRYFDFPAPIGFVEAHPDFRVIAAGNTYGLGADYEYVGRNQLDAASLDRFALVRIDYSNAIELAVAQGDHELVNFCDNFRKGAETCGIKTIVSYRGIGRIAKMKDLIGLEETIKSCLLKGMDKDDIAMIYNNMNKNSCGEYEQVLANIVRA